MKKCEFCNRKCNTCRVCCMRKEMQIYLVNHAMQKLSFLSLYKESSFCCPPIFENSPIIPTRRIENDRKIPESDSIIVLVEMETLRKIKMRLKNMKKYYPDIYNFEGNVIEKWGKNLAMDEMNQDLLNLDPKCKSLFWI
ncbi:hypothetical protein JTB14_025708 [Gonioctena quinquepunctata]|nr:hypothetical protein JTB14_025708 [Gonioctena quinquepunctata]